MISRLLALFALLLPAPALADSVVVTADRMLDVLTGRMVEEPVIVITDGRIAAVVGRGGARPVIPEGARRIDLTGRTLLPGLIDMHVHLATTPLVSGYRELEFTDAFWTTLGPANARAMLEAGFTTVRSLGADDYADVAVMEGIEGGFYPGPRVIPSGPSFGATGGHCGGPNGLPPSLARGADRGVDGADEVRHMVRELHKYGARVIKVCATGGVLSRNTDPGAQQMTEEELRAAAEEAHRLGLRVAAHAWGADGIKAAIRAGIDTVEHAGYIDAEGLRLARERGTWLSMDLYNTEYIQAEGARNGMLEENLAKDREVATIQREAFRRAHDAGVGLVFGTDAGVMPHGHAGRQFATMVANGMTPIEAIRAATADAARALGMERDVGAIAVGRYGDLVAVAGDPTQDVRLLERPDTVIKGGVAVGVER